MITPIADFVRRYQDAGITRFHMPGHKGASYLGCENWDITEVAGADALYEADGIIAQSEANATALFGSQRTCYSTEGSSQCIRAMLYLAATQQRPTGAKPVIVAARNVHKTFVCAAALLDIDIVWLWPEQQHSLCGCPVSAEQLETVLAALVHPPAAIYLTSPDYLGGMADIAALAAVAHRHDTMLMVDNAHGAYLRFLQPSLHPLDLGADLCCDSAHKTLPVLTGGAYLHIGKGLPESYAQHAKAAMAMFGSTSPSYLTLASLDLCNRYLAQQASAHLAACVAEIEQTKAQLREHNWQIEDSDPLRIAICAPQGETGRSLADKLRAAGMECEFSDDTHLVLMLTPDNSPEELARLVQVLGRNQAPAREILPQPVVRPKQAIPMRQALFAPHTLVPAQAALGRICGMPTVSCPPAIPIAVFGEEITAEMVELFLRYGVEQIDVLQ